MATTLLHTICRIFLHELIILLDMLKLSNLLCMSSKNFSLVTNFVPRYMKTEQCFNYLSFEWSWILKVKQLSLFFNYQKIMEVADVTYFTVFWAKILLKGFEISAYRMMKVVTLMRERKGLKRSRPQLAV